MHAHSGHPSRLLAAGTALAAVLAATSLTAPAVATAAGGTNTGFTRTHVVASTIPGNGDVNPYGVAVVPRSTGRLIVGDVLVSNFNNAPTTGSPGGQQGRGSTIVEISPRGHRRLFAHVGAASVPGGVGLSTALVVLRSGWVIVGSLPTTDGTPATMRPGALIVLDPRGQVRAVLRGHGIDGPWDATTADHGRTADLFVSNVLPGITAGQPPTTRRGDVIRLRLDLRGARPRILCSTVVADDLPVRTDPAALVVGPTGLALAPGGTLFVADTAGSRIARIPRALTRSTPVDAGAGRATVASGAPLNGPLGLALTHDGDLLTVNSGDNTLVEITPRGTVITTRDLDPVDPPGGALFGLATSTHPRGVYYVNDDTNTLNLLH
ncbi:hypothetical protein [Leekyejoonella antrihumi]|uniref:ScyD/ScyE family protein n=1 Tax=Leekyejoonella antrihumi TaxID=1660198 RepID=A0A563E451_9MICO|nr:hypothetical protein [Leekyejoonella antrihumi]TWP37296.1 hypothetical protein FGL98_05930 [Leekyejoonella antrihumi]